MYPSTSDKHPVCNIYTEILGCYCLTLEHVHVCRIAIQPIPPGDIPAKIKSSALICTTPKSYVSEFDYRIKTDANCEAEDKSGATNKMRHRGSQ